MINPQSLILAFKNSGINYFTGVPDSILDGFIKSLNNKKFKCIHRVAANEGGAIGLAIGYSISTKKIPVVYMQNSGLGNAINPLVSIVDKKVYGIPMILLIGSRGGFNVPDELQHCKMGPITLKTLKTLGIKYKVLNKYKIYEQIKYAKKFTTKYNQPFAIVVKPKTISKSLDVKIKARANLKFKRIDFIQTLLQNINTNFRIISTTGYTSRELDYLQKKRGKRKSKSFFCIGAMGHANQIATEIALQDKNKKIIVLDGDGALLMHLGNLSVVRRLKPKNLLHILFDNSIHESTGSHQLPENDINYGLVFKNFGYKSVINITNPLTLKKILKKKLAGPAALIISIKPGTINNLPRPKREDLLSFKKNF